MESVFINCLQPRFVTNRYTGQEVLVECGRCASCRMKKSAVRTTLCKLESCCHRYHYFVTLTFDNASLPTARLILASDEYERYDVVRESDGLVLGTVYFDDHLDKMALIKKCCTPINTVPILDVRYVQLFMKRLRKYLKKFTNEKIRYFVCGEYGPVHFRPHYHLSLWFDEEITSSCILQGIRSCWPYGRVDASISTGKSTSYVASYVNSSQYLPRIFELPGAAPFSSHSVYLGEQFYSSEIESIPEIKFADIATKRICINGFNSDVFLWRSLKNRLFPKLKGFTSQSEHERVLTYSAYAVVRDWTQETKVIDLAKFVTDYVRYEDFYHPIPVVNDFLQLLRHGLSEYMYVDGVLHYVRPFLVDYNRFERMVYMLLLQSRRFLIRNCHGDDSYHSVLSAVRQVEEFYKYMDSVALRQQLQQEEELTKANKPVEFLFHNSLILDDYKKSSVYKSYYSTQMSRYSTFCKHKKLNDLNKKFVY